MNEALRYTKGLGSSTVYTRIPHNGQFWDFASLVWSDTETANCKRFMAEFGDTSAEKSWYYATFTQPSGGPWPVEIIDSSTSEVIGNDIAPNVTDLLTGPGTVTCAAILAGAARQLQDITNVTWPPAVLLVYMNYGIREIIDAKPEAYSVTGNVLLIAGTKQVLPDSANVLVDVKRNMGSDGATPGRAITPLDRQAMNYALPDWHTFPANTEVRHIIPDDRNPFHFDVFPPQPDNTTQQVEAVWSAYPPKATDPINDQFPLKDEYEVPAVDYIIYRALSEETTIPNALNKANGYLMKFQRSLGIKITAEAKVRNEGQ